MKNIKEYNKLKKEYIKLKMLNSDNVYDYLTDKQISVIRKYYEVYTKYLFNKLMGSLRLSVSKSKVEKLVELKGVGSWEFAGMVDALKRGAATCELGHPLRYVYSAKNVENGKILHFGSRCVGDFFDIDEKGINALTKIKDVMFVELKDIVSIKEQGLFEEHYKYDCDELGNIYITLGIDGVKKILNLNPLMPIVCDFMLNGLPLPNSLIEEVLKYKSDLISMLSNNEFLGLDELKINQLKESKIDMISRMFTNSENHLKMCIKNCEKEKKSSDFYNFNTIEDINVNASIWLNRNDRLLKVYAYFEKMGVSKDYVRIYRYMVENGYKRELPDLYLGVEILVLFTPDIIISQNGSHPRVYTYKGFELKESSKDRFDSLIDYMATREFIMSLKEITTELENEDKRIAERNKEIEEMMSFLKEHILDEKYRYVQGIGGVNDIVNRKCLEFKDMTPKQQSYVESVYKAIKDIDAPKKVEEETSVSVEDREINNRYKLVEKPDILAKIQRLQSEAGDKLSEKLLGIIQSIMTYKQVSDKQMNRINEAYSLYILKEDIVDSRENKIDKSIENKKWNLIEREDVKEKIMKIKSLPDYSSIPSGVRNIFENVLKYNSVSDRQIETIERTYNRYFRGR